MRRLVTPSIMCKGWRKIGENGFLSLQEGYPVTIRLNVNSGGVISGNVRSRK